MIREIEAPDLTDGLPHPHAPETWQAEAVARGEHLAVAAAERIRRLADALERVYRDGVCDPDGHGWDVMVAQAALCGAERVLHEAHKGVTAIW